MLLLLRRRYHAMSWSWHGHVYLDRYIIVFFCFFKRTSLEDADLLNGSLVEERAGLEELEVGLPVVGDAGLDGSVADHLQLHLEGRVALAEVDGHGASQGGQEGDASE